MLEFMNNELGHYMPTFDKNPLENLQFAPGDADEDIDLTKMSHNEALSYVDELLTQDIKSRSYCLRFAAAKGDGSETLFQPLGRRLLAARKDGVLARFLPISDGAGYFIAFPS